MSPMLMFFVGLFVGVLSAGIAMVGIREWGWGCDVGHVTIVGLPNEENRVAAAKDLHAAMEKVRLAIDETTRSAAKVLHRWDVEGTPETRDLPTGVAPAAVGGTNTPFNIAVMGRDVVVLDGIDAPHVREYSVSPWVEGAIEVGFSQGESEVTLKLSRPDLVLMVQILSARLR